ncbi:hypothetical protein PhaeoP30_00654 [Phaeobacter inhibens]|nr:hypothetical protein PhaeoP30_00654 [Phaeobacter inhibens]AUQ61632.1 hypothetical protein PhaeoP51_00614 [Phaeobacter inhibens]AUQ81606.1 hypothetical protein PhaeoP57_00646 [Phaeobacter inhibens]AUQ89262.1 hypothetical protein PhaeoP24_00614 [Phaeobacter inhibens]AUR06883.1 hypothetical protein PhaeoP59_00681 [Phaeobacter inhibens]
MVRSDVDGAFRYEWGAVLGSAHGAAAGAFGQLGDRTLTKARCCFGEIRANCGCPARV